MMSEFNNGLNGIHVSLNQTNLTELPNLRYGFITQRKHCLTQINRNIQLRFETVKNRMKMSEKENVLSRPCSFCQQHGSVTSISTFDLYNIRIHRSYLMPTCNDDETTKESRNLSGSLICANIFRSFTRSFEHCQILRFLSCLVSLNGLS